MMQSVALTELNCNDEEFVIVDAPRALIESRMFGGSSRTLSSLADDDDASYDYCDDGYSMPPSQPSQWDETYGATGRAISDEFNLPPNLTDTDVEDAIDYLQTDKFPSLELSDTRMNQPYQRSLCLIDGAAFGAISEMTTSDRPSASSIPSSSVSGETKDSASTATEGEMSTRLPGNSSATGSGASSISLTRLSNKKRRKQVLLAKKAAAASAAAARLAEIHAKESSSSVSTATGATTKTLSSSLHKKSKKSSLGRSKSKKLRNIC